MNVAETACSAYQWHRKNLSVTAKKAKGTD